MQINSDLILRKATAKDKAEQLARCIYETDAYIYPAICESCDDSRWVELVRKCLAKKGNVFSLENLFVAEREGSVVAIACVLEGSKPYFFLGENEIPPALAEGVATVQKGYFAPLFEDNMALDGGYNLVNLCVDSRYRGQGIGKALLSYLLEKYKGEAFYLDVIADNEIALSLYRSLGFSVLTEYNGFSGDGSVLPCLHMKKEP